jgi:hypothetical protein
MSDNRENIRIVSPVSYFLMIILALGLLIFHNTRDNPPDKQKNPTETELSFNQSSGTFSSGIQLQFFQKTRISDSYNFKLLSFTRIQFLENKKTDQKITLFYNIRKRIDIIPTSFLPFHLFPAEKDELPLLS